MTERIQMMKTIGAYCKQFRIDKLGLTLTEFTQVGQHNIKNISAFESGRANNIKYLYDYYRKAKEEDRLQFATDLFELL